MTPDRPPGRPGSRDEDRYPKQRPSARALRLDLDTEGHFLPETHLLAVVDAELVAVDRRRSVRAADLLLRERVRLAEELMDRQRHRPGRALQSELALHRPWCLAVEARELAFEGCRRKFLDIEH